MRSKKFSLLSCAVLAGVFTAGMLAPAVVEAQHTTTAQSLGTSANVLVQGAVTNAGAAAGSFNGILNLTNATVQNGQLVVSGLLTGTIHNLNGTTTAVSQTITAPLSSTSAGCPILSLSLGPLHLDVLGLVIDLNQINLNIVAQPGAGNLLGNLLCDVANLLNNGGALSAIATDLQNLLNVLNGL